MMTTDSRYRLAKRTFYEKIMGHSIIYDWLRPYIFGGFHFSQVFNWLEVIPEDVVLDVGCGTGYAMKYIKQFKSFHGFDINRRVLKQFRIKHPAPNISLYPKTLELVDMESIQPTKVILIGLLHHLSDLQVQELFRILAFGGTVRRLITLDTIYIENKWTTKLVAYLDRGKFVRKEDGYRRLIESSPFRITEATRLSTGIKVGLFFASCLASK